MMRSVVILGVGLLGMAALASAQTPIDERRRAVSDGTVKISNAVGTVRVVGWNRDSIAVSGTLGGGSTIEVLGGKRESMIRVALASDSGTVPPSHLEVWVPRRSAVAVRSVAATVDVSGVTGTADVESQTGSVQISGSLRTVYAETAAGALTLDVSTKVLRARSVGGDVTVRGARGYVDVSTVSGRVFVSGQGVWETEITSISGDIRFEGTLSEGASLYAESHGGTVELAFPANVAADFDVASVLGRVENEFGPQTGSTFSTREGGAQVKVKSFKGTVRLLKLARR